MVIAFGSNNCSFLRSVILTHHTERGRLLPLLFSGRFRATYTTCFFDLLLTCPHHLNPYLVNLFDNDATLKILIYPVLSLLQTTLAFSFRLQFGTQYNIAGLLLVLGGNRKLHSNSSSSRTAVCSLNLILLMDKTSFLVPPLSPYRA